ncbi:lathosterol oxidase isoform X1 [Carettochelys insculpta]|uniref:lathosterol oxidase isoform X1 n=1 Tax=Carettochelys insculpta TaxID=44489 RepID=UPI003EC0F03F
MAPSSLSKEGRQEMPQTGSHGRQALPGPQPATSCKGPLPPPSPLYELSAAQPGRTHSCPPWRPSDSSCRRTPCWQCCAPSPQLYPSSSGGCAVPPELPHQGTVPRRLWTHPSSTDWWERVVLGEWLWNSCMSTHTFEICHWLAPALRHQDTCMGPALTLEKRVAIAIWKLATPDSYCSMGQQFRVDKATIGAVLREVIKAINAMLLHRVVRLGDVYKHCRRFPGPGLPELHWHFGWHTHPLIRAPPHSAGRYFNRKGYHSVVQQALVDARGRFTDLYVGWASCTHDARVFRNSGLCHRMGASTFVPQREIPVVEDVTMPLCSHGS